MREKSISMREQQQDAVKPPAIVSDSLIIQKISDYVSKWYVANRPTGERFAKVVKPLSISEDQGNQYPIYY